MECTLHGGHVAQSELSALTVPPILILSAPDELSTRQQKPLYTIFMDITFLHHIPTRMVCFTKNASHLTQSSGGPGKE